MIKLFVVIALLSFSVLAESIKIDENFFTALRKTETLGRSNFGIGAIGKHGELGPYQITKAYWLDAKKYDKIITGPFRNCAQKEYSEQVITAYLNYYAPAACAEKNYCWLAEIHNCGPKKRWKSFKYWNRFKSFLYE